jgi:hypothetical protein
MLRAAYHDTRRELLVDGCREDYERLRNEVREVMTSGIESKLVVHSTGPVEVSQLIVRRGPPPNRVSYEFGGAVFSIAPSLEAQFVSFIQFPAHTELPRYGVGYHHHFEGDANGAYVASDSLPVVFGLDQE